MTRRAIILSISVVALLLLVILMAGPWREQETRVQAKLLASSADPTGFMQVEGPPGLMFPADYGAHPDYQTEWCYYTGNVQSAAGQHFGYQLTIFRRALVPPADQRKRDSSLAADQVYMAHFALTNVAANRFRSFERFSRGAAGLAGAKSTPYQVWLQDWSVEETEPNI